MIREGSFYECMQFDLCFRVGVGLSLEFRLIWLRDTWPCKDVRA